MLLTRFCLKALFKAKPFFTVKPIKLNREGDRKLVCHQINSGLIVLPLIIYIFKNMTLLVVQRLMYHLC